MAVDGSLVPVVVDLIGQGDDVPLLEAQLALVLRLKVVGRPAARLAHGRWAGRSQLGSSVLNTPSLVLIFNMFNS